MTGWCGEVANTADHDVGSCVEKVVLIPGRCLHTWQSAWCARESLGHLPAPPAAPALPACTPPAHSHRIQDACAQAVPAARRDRRGLNSACAVESSLRSVELSCKLVCIPSGAQAVVCTDPAAHALPCGTDASAAVLSCIVSMGHRAARHIGACCLRAEVAHGKLPTAGESGDARSGASAHLQQGLGRGRQACRPEPLQVPARGLSCLCLPSCLSGPAQACMLFRMTRLAVHWRISLPHGCASGASPC